MHPLLLYADPAEFSALYEKHKVLYRREVKGALSLFGKVLQAIHCNRMALMLKDVSSSVNNDDSVQEGTNESIGINLEVLDLDPETVLGAGGVSMGKVGTSPDHAQVSGGTSPAHAEVSGGINGYIWTGAVDTSVPAAAVDSTVNGIVPPGPPSPSPIAHDASPIGLTKKDAAVQDIPMSPCNSARSLPSPAFQSDVPSYPSPTRSAGPTGLPNPSPLV